MSSHHRSHLKGAALSAVLAITGAAAACGSTHAESKPSATAAGTEPPQPSGRSASASPSATESHGGGGARGSADPGGARSADQASARADQGSSGDDDAELVVSRDIVARCPKLSAVRQHVAELDPDMVWLAVLDSLGECMGAGEPLAAQSLGVSGDEEHRHVVREVLGSRGVAPTRVIAMPTSAQGAAECQGGADCSKRVEITIAPAL
jgi:hypothetical protein